MIGRLLLPRTALLGALAAILTSACAGPSTIGSSSTPKPSVSAETPGSIAGRMGYPAEGIPAMTIFALRQSGAGAAFYAVRTIKNQESYSIQGVAPGTYHVYAAATSGLSPRQRFIGGYTKFVLCGLLYTCADHSPVPVIVTSGGSVTGIAPTDFYTPGPETFPFVPAGAKPIAAVPSPAASYPDAKAAALYEAQRGTEASTVLRGAFGPCPANEACVAMQDQHDGTRAAYFLAQAGSNRDVASCAIYVFRNATGWHPLNTACGRYPAPGKSVSATFMGSGCINVRANAGYTYKILECLPVDTMVTIDGGPVFVQETTASDAADLNRLWWHLVGHGWMVHQYLTGPFMN